MPRSFNIVTLGCKVNQYESAFLEAQLLRAGWVKAGPGKRADVALVNTCIVTQRAGHQSRQAIRKAIRENPDAIIAAIGCYAQVFPDELSRIKGIGLIAGNTVKGELPELLLTTGGRGQQMIVVRDFDPKLPFDFLPLRHFPGRTRTYLKIQDGCQSFCSFCIVPFARGPYRSLPPARVLAMIESLARQGYKEIVLTGIHLGKYGIDLKEDMSLNRLLCAIGREGLPLRIRLSSLEPNEIDAEIIEMVASEGWLCKHFHIPLQSGDDMILRRMNRNYTAREFRELVESIATRIPLAGIGVDVMAGFPGEDTTAHQNSYSLIRDLPVSYLHVFPFSPRTGTAASNLGGPVAPQLIKKRAAELRELGQQKKAAFYKACLKKEFLVLAERWHSPENGMMRGMSDNYIPVLFPAAQDLKGELIPVRMERVDKNVMISSIMSYCCPSRR
jgi:threonylcarbamoyladenosine tRNA methylthiotransferase MtaB